MDTTAGQVRTVNGIDGYNRENRTITNNFDGARVNTQNNLQTSVINADFIYFSTSGAPYEQLPRSSWGC